MVRFDPTRPDFSPYGFSCVRWTPTTMSHSDQHNKIKFSLLEGGRIVYRIGGQKVTVPAGRLTAYWAGVPHQILEFEHLTEYFVLTVPLAWFLHWRLPDRLTQPVVHGRNGLPRHHARLASGRWSGATGRAFYRQGSDERLQICFVTSHPPFPSFAWHNRPHRRSQREMAKMLRYDRPNARNGRWLLAPDATP